MESRARFFVRLAGASLLVFSFCLSSPTSARAQVTRADSAAVLLSAGQTFQDEGRWEVAEAIYFYILERYGDTPSYEVARLALEESPVEGSARSANVELMVWATTFGAWVGAAIPASFGANDPEAYGAAILVGGPAGFFGARAYSRSRPLSAGQVRAITWGSLWGTWQGIGLMEILDIGQEEYCDGDYCYEDGPDEEAVFLSLLVGGLAGTLGGAILARKPISRGVATTASLGSLWGTWFGVAGGVVAGLEDDGLLASTVIVGDVGLLVTGLLAPGWDFSRSRARLISIGGVLGGLVGLGVDLLAQPDDDKVLMAIPLAGSILGLGVTANMTKGMDRPRGLSSPNPDDGMAGMEGGSSLLNFRGRDFSFGVPTPYPTLVPVETSTGFSYKPALGFTLLSSRF